MNDPLNVMRTEALAKLADRLVQLTPGAPAVHVSNGRWMFMVHRYDDGFTCLRLYLEENYRFDIPMVNRRDIGRFFADPLDFVNFILGDPSDKFVLEATDL